MLYALEDIKRDVRISLDENAETEALLNEGDSDALTLDELIGSKVEEAVRIIHTTAPAHLVEQGHNLSGDIYWGDKESGWVLLPGDFMRLVVFEMSDWERPVYTAISTLDPSYALQRSRVKALRGTAERPVCAIGVRPEGLALEFYSCKSEEAWMSRGVYLPYPKINTEGYIDISERCYRAVVYMAGALTLTAIGETDKAKAMIEISEKLIR